MKIRSLQNIRTVVCITSILFTFPSCKKYLEAKPDQSIATPATMSDIEGILNNYNFMNARYPSAAEVSADNFYLTTTDLNALNDRQRNFYLWQKFDDVGGDYTSAYTTIEYANIVLETLDKIDGEAVKKAEFSAEARFVRAASHFALAQLFAAPYQNGSAANELGIALRTTANINERPYRSTLQETYETIIKDLTLAVRGLPVRNTIKFRPNRAAAYGLLSRVNLTMQNYQAAELYADSCLAINNTLIDYNKVSATATIPFAQFNDEVLYDARTSPPTALATSRAKIDTNLFASYANNDLRKTIYFRTAANGTRNFKGNYTGLNNASVFTGVATDEIYLNSAEAAVRNGRLEKGLDRLNTLLSRRWRTGTFQPYQSMTPDALLTLILNERRKELPFRAIRWADLRRLNKETGRSQVLKRVVNNQTYELLPSSPRYILAIDRKAVDISGLQQNP